MKSHGTPTVLASPQESVECPLERTTNEEDILAYRYRTNNSQRPSLCFDSRNLGISTNRILKSPS